ncbi:hypothetical protein K470DRAFT_91718 [Piedraia hortae CBS 480.64]|uniref:STI1 domain-containing protein n=1 Tax=Piedraia hortae CBS 480.64 TaxID=1314780 RepID=A0A6A7BXX8_9PEZI|nr:hypothetical protein K470DRAFT_91718 [Piedraia hortae CBS 480.64]
MATESKKRLALAIIDFLNKSLKDGTLQAEDADSVEIASNCIAECFHVDPSDSAAMKQAVGEKNLVAIYEVYDKIRNKSSASTVGSAGEGLGKGAQTTEESERLKGQGNAALQRKEYATAIELYTRALEIAPLNPVYLSNRAAAYSASGQHEEAKNDAELATASDPSYTKAWSRLGLARFALGDAKGSMEAYKSGIDAEGNGGSEAMKKGYETAKRRAEADGALDGPGDESATRSAAGGAGGAGGMPDLGGLASMLGGGGGAGGGGMPDLASLMNNPMMRQMAQNVMSNPDMMNNIMNNPQLRNMANRFGGASGGGAGGGGTPDLRAMMNDPSIAEL